MWLSDISEKHSDCHIDSTAVNIACYGYVIANVGTATGRISWASM